MLPTSSRMRNFCLCLTQRATIALRQQACPVCSAAVSRFCTGCRVTVRLESVPEPRLAARSLQLCSQSCLSFSSSFSSSSCCCCAWRCGACSSSQTQRCQRHCHPRPQAHGYHFVNGCRPGSGSDGTDRNRLTVCGRAFPPVTAPCSVLWRNSDAVLTWLGEPARVVP